MKHYLRFLMALVMIVFAGGVVCADEFTYTVASKTTVTSNNEPDGVTHTFKSTDTNNGTPAILNSGKNMTLTISGLSGKINSLKLSLKRTNRTTGKGNINVKVGDNQIISENITNSQLSTIQKDLSYEAKNSISTNEDITIVLNSTGNSIYCYSFTINYERTATDTRTKTSLSFGEEYDGKTITKYIGDENIYSIPATLSPAIDGAKITYKSSEPDLVYVDEKGDMMVYGSTPGTATITAEYAGDNTYAPSSASYTVQVKKPVSMEDGVFDFTSGELDYGSGLQPRSDYESTEYDQSTTWRNGTITLSTDGKIRWWKANDGITLRVYSKAKLTISVPSNYIITNIALTGVNNGITTDCGTFDNGQWTGKSNEITFTVGSSTKNIKTITVTYYKALTTAASSFATYAADDAVDYSAAGLSAYAIELNEAEGKVSYNEISGTVEKGTPVLVKGKASTSYAMIPSTGTATAVTTSLKISDGSVTAADNLYYGFATMNGVSGFKLVQNGVTIPAKKGYLLLTKEMSNAKTFYAFDGNTTGIEETFPKAEAEKTFAPMYNISGQRVGEGYKGIVIVNGKKYVK